MKIWNFGDGRKLAHVEIFLISSSLSLFLVVLYAFSFLHSINRLLHSSEKNVKFIGLGNNSPNVRQFAFFEQVNSFKQWPEKMVNELYSRSFIVPVCTMQCIRACVRSIQAVIITFQRLHQHNAITEIILQYRLAATADDETLCKSIQTLCLRSDAVIFCLCVCLGSYDDACWILFWLVVKKHALRKMLALV